MNEHTARFLKDTGAEVPVICGAMYPCSNAELVAAASEAGGIGIVQPISLTYAHGHKDFREGLRKIASLTSKPIGMNLIVEQSSKRYEDRMKQWLDTALEEGVRYFITALGNPGWVVDKVSEVGGVVYHDVTAKKWAQKAVDNGVQGLICVNNRAGGHAGTISPEQLLEDMASFNLPLVCAGGVGSPGEFKDMLDLGYGAVQLGTRFIATTECTAHPDYKAAIVKAKAKDIVLTDKISGVPVSVIKTPYIARTGTEAGWASRKLLKHPRFKHYMRMVYTIQSIWKLKRSNAQGSSYKDYFQAGKSVEHIDGIVPTEEIIRAFAAEIGA